MRMASAESSNQRSNRLTQPQRARPTANSRARRMPHATSWTIAALMLAQPVSAQCTSNASSCITCHDAQGQRPVLQSAQPWHIDHAFGDLCASCHAGDPAAPAQAQAHLGRRDPLADPSTTCASCHEADFAARAERYIATVPPANSPPEQKSQSASDARSNVVSTATHLLAAVAAGLGIVLFFVLRRALGRSRKRTLRGWLRAKLWSPYLAGALLGVVVAFSELVYGQPLAVAGAFDKLAAYLGRWLFPASQYYRHLMSPGITWQVWLVVGLFVGAFASSKLAAEARLRWLPDEQWQARFGPSRWRRLAVAFFGAALVQIGAGIAGGCTSGLAISGGVVLAPAAFLFMAGMFAGGIPTAWFWHRGSSEP